MVRAISGTQGTQQGDRFLIADPRDEFHLPQDHQIIVYFEWEGPLGQHHFEGTWRDPTGRSALTSNFDGTSYKSPFYGYWVLTLSQGVQTGLWALEAKIDGEPAGEHTFRILNDAPEPSTAPPLSRPAPLPTLAEIYSRSTAASVFIEKLNDQGEKIGFTSAFDLGGLLVTAFQSLDGATLLRLIFPDGRTVTTDRVLAWNRQQDWAILKTDLAGHAELDRGDPVKVGDIGYLIDVPDEGSRTLETIQITGLTHQPEQGDRLEVSWTPHPGAIGAPLIDERGRVVGVLGGIPLPGASSVLYPGLQSIPGVPTHLLAVPISLVPLAPSGSPDSLPELMRTGVLAPPLTLRTDAVIGMFTNEQPSKSDTGIRYDSRQEFSRKEGKIAALVTWDPKRKVRDTMQLVIFDKENRVVGQSESRKISLDVHKLLQSSWDFSIDHLAPGIYRVDVKIGEVVEWRGFFRVTE